MNIDKELLQILACPQCKGELSPYQDGEGLLCPHCRLVYPVREDIPIMLPEEAIDQDKWEKRKG